MGAVELTIDDDAGERPVASSAEDFALAHLSDLHLSSLDGVSLRSLLDKRMLGYVSWLLRRRHEHRAEVLDVLRADLEAEHLDHIAVTGDLTHLACKEFQEADLVRWARRTITVVPAITMYVLNRGRRRAVDHLTAETMPAHHTDEHFPACAYGVTSL
jgi:3',5'-cyclic AMP phosphodiesterase CpdA